MTMEIKTDYVWLMITGNDGIYGIFTTEKLTNIVNERNGSHYKIKKVQANVLGELIGISEV